MGGVGSHRKNPNGRLKKYIIFQQQHFDYSNKSNRVSDLFAFRPTNLILEEMSIENCPVLTPTWKEFQNFSQFVQKIDKLYKSRYGMVKVIPPSQWKPASSAYQSRLHGLMINGPIEQNIFGKGGVYECLHIQKKSLSLKQYKTKMGVFDKITDGHTPQQVEDMFWKNIVFSPPLYGADLLNTLMDQKAGPWRLSNLESLLKHSVKTDVRGVTTPYCYVGSWKTLFCWHKEDLDLESINYLHEGKSKFWYSIPYHQSHILQKEAKIYFPEHFSQCSQHMRHKTTLFNPYQLKKKYPELKISKTEHKAGQFMLILGGSYHCGFNFGFNIAEAVNYATVGWLSRLPNSKSCSCSRNSVRACHRQILNNLLSSPYSSSKEVLQFEQYVLDNEEKENETIYKLKQIDNVKREFSKKIKKEKKVKNIKIEGQEYEIDKWASCDNCNQWRKISFDLKEGRSFRCSDVGKQCFIRERIGKEYITL